MVVETTRPDLELEPSAIDSLGESIVRQLVRSPRLPVLVRHFQRYLREERKRRERFYEEMREDQKVEFINGEVIMQSPAKLRHSLASSRLDGLIGAYVRKHQLGVVVHEKTLIVLTRNDYEPDLCFFAQPRASQLKPDQMKFPAPDLVVEVLSPSTEVIDRGIKFEDYAAHGVTEYWLVDAEFESVEQYVLEAGRYVLLTKTKTGRIQSTAICGFDIPVRAVFEDGEQIETLRVILSAG